jgi:integrase
VGNKTVALLRYVKTESGWRRVGVERNRRGETLSIKKGETVLERGLYQLRWYEGAKAKFLSVGESLDEAVIAQDKKIAELKAPVEAKKAGGTFVPEDPTKETLAVLRDKFIRIKETSKKDKETVSAYKNLISQFLEGCGKRYADQIEGIDLLEFCQGLRDKGLSERTVQNYYGTITAFLVYAKVDHKTLVNREDRPHQDDPDPIPYDKQDVVKFLSHLKTERHRLFFETLLKVGLQEREATFLEWNDLHFREGCVVVAGIKNLALTVNGKEKAVRFMTKTRKDRTIPLEAGLLERLKSWKQQNPGTKFVFGTRQDLPDGHMLESCKQAAKAAELNPNDWYLVSVRSFHLDRVRVSNKCPLIFKRTP